MNLDITICYSYVCERYHCRTYMASIMNIHNKTPTHVHTHVQASVLGVRARIFLPNTVAQTKVVRACMCVCVCMLCVCQFVRVCAMMYAVVCVLCQSV